MQFTILLDVSFLSLPPSFTLAAALEVIGANNTKTGPLHLNNRKQGSVKFKVEKKREASKVT